MPIAAEISRFIPTYVGLMVWITIIATPPAVHPHIRGVNACPVCAVNMAECTGQEPEPTPDPETEPEPEQEPAGLNPAMLLVVLAVLGGIGALVYFKFIKQKPKTKGSDNLDDYDYGEDDTEQEDEDPWETEESDEPEDADRGGDEESENPAK
mgnify:CR=1 FL=1